MFTEPHCVTGIVLRAITESRTNKVSICPVEGVPMLVRAQQYTRKPGDEPDNFRYDERHKGKKYCVGGYGWEGQGRPVWETALGLRSEWWFRWHRVQSRESQAEEMSAKVLRQKPTWSALRTQRRPVWPEVSEWRRRSEGWARPTLAASWRPAQRLWLWI